MRRPQRQDRCWRRETRARKERRPEVGESPAPMFERRPVFRYRLVVAGLSRMMVLCAIRVAGAGGGRGMVVVIMVVIVICRLIVMMRVRVVVVVVMDVTVPIHDWHDRAVDMHVIVMVIDEM